MNLTVLPAAPESVPAARRFVLEALSGLPHALLDAIALMVSELATNSVLHADSSFEISVEQIEHTVRVQVSDTGGGAARLQSPGPNQPRGRGLRIVDTMSTQWGVISSSVEVGKTVWFTLAVPAVQ